MGAAPRGALVAAAFAMAALVQAGCIESRDSLRESIARLKTEIARLEAEKANAVAKAASLDDERLILAKKAEGCDERRRERSLAVVRLVPGEEEEAPAVSVPVPAPSAKDNGKRPLLTLVGDGRSAGGPSDSGFDVGAGPRPILGGDDLGVVPSAGQPTTTAMPPRAEPVNDAEMALFHEAYRSYTNARYEEALAGFSKFVAESPKNPYADNALYWRGECLLAQGKMIQSVGEYERLLRRYPASEKTPAALLRIGFVYDRLGDTDRARDYYFKVVDGFPGSEEARKASRRAAELQSSGGPSLGMTTTSASQGVKR